MPLMTNSEELGWQRGYQEGLQEGRLEGTQQFTLRILERYIGGLDEATRNYVVGLPLADVEGLCVDALDFTSAADLQRWRSHRAN